MPADPCRAPIGVVHDPAPMGGTSDNIISMFIGWQAGRGLSQHTIRRRHGSLTSFATWCEPMVITDADFTDVEDWLATFTSPRTRHAYRSDVNVFFRWAVKRRIVDRNPVEDVDSVRVPKPLPRPLPADLIPVVIATAPDDQLRMAIALAAYAGLRRSEIVNLEAEDVSLPTSRLVVRRGKGGKDRSVLIIPPLADVLALSMPRFGRLVPCAPDSIGKRISRHLRNLGVDGTAHQLRHTAATEAARHADLRTVADFLGHSSVVTTEGYAALVRDWSSLAHMYEPASMN